MIIHEDNKPRLQRRLAVVKGLIEGKDGQVRAAHIRTKITRQLDQWPSCIHWRCTVKNAESKMAPLFQKKLSNQLMVHPKIISRIQLIPILYTMRAAASKAIQKIKKWIGILGSPSENV